MAQPNASEERVLVLAPTGRDGSLVQEMLGAASIQSELCASIEDLCERAGHGAGALFIAEESLTVAGIAELSRMLEQQPPWSDIPVIVSTGMGATTESRLRNIDSLGSGGNIVIVERPVRILTMVVTVQSALRARRRQYLMRNLTNQIEHERSKLEALIMQVPVAICILEGPQLRYTVANASYLEMVGTQASDLIGRPIGEVFPAFEASGHAEKARRVYLTGERFDMPEHAFSFGPRDDGETEGHYQAAYRPLRDQSGRIVGVVIVTMELTAQVRARRALEMSRSEADSARAAAESANRAKDEFLAMLGHELRNPLAPIITALDLMRLREGVVTRERAIIERQARHMAALVDDLLDVSRITRSKIELKRRVLDLTDVVSKAAETAAPLLEKRKHRLVTRIPARTLYVNGDPDRLTQVFSNILTNAAKYTDDGGRITIDALCEGEELVVRIADTGRGISPQMLPHIFDLFSQEQQNLDRSQGGLGLGLAIVKSLVEMHGGSVEVKSEGKGRGSEFTLRLPAAPKPAPAPPAEDDSPQKSSAGKRDEERPSILLVDDNKDAAEMLAESLSLMGYSVRIAHDGPEALAGARESDPPTAAFLDIGLPVMDGYELARQLRALPGWSPVSLVAVTGYGQASDRKQSMDAGFDVHLVKPVALSALKKALEKVR